MDIVILLFSHHAINQNIKSIYRQGAAWCLKYHQLKIHQQSGCYCDSSNLQASFVSRDTIFKNLIVAKFMKYFYA